MKVRPASATTYPADCVSRPLLKREKWRTLSYYGVEKGRTHGFIVGSNIGRAKSGYTSAAQK
jgi:hypothetical protein